MAMIVNPYYESKIYVGSLQNLPTPPSLPIAEEMLIKTIGQQQEEYKIVIPLRVSLTKFVSGTTYRERGWEISAINYPRVGATVEEIDEFMLILGRRLLTDFFQHRVTIVNSKEIIMLTAEEDRYEDE